jgi:hypothetical protein
MKPNEAFKNWYKTEGIRTPAYPVEGETSLHEEYARIAFQGGYKAAIDYCAAVVDKVGTELGKTS